MNTKPNYLDQFVDSLRFLAELDKSFKQTSPDFTKIKATILKEQRDEDLLQLKLKLRDKLLVPLAVDYVNRISEVSTIAHNCHSISDGFIKTWQGFEISEHCQLAITIGNVYYKNRNIYGLTTSNLKTILNEGNLASKKLDVHVWLTLDDMTVIDLTIIPSLCAMGILSESDYQSAVLLWNDIDTSDFRFEPLLVDNNFFSKVDNGLTRPL